MAAVTAPKSGQFRTSWSPGWSASPALDPDVA
jgi:hypothetical protein